MGKLKTHFADKLERDAMASTFKTAYPDDPEKSFAEWCDWLRATHDPKRELRNHLTDGLRRRIVNAEYAEMKMENPDDYGVAYHVFEFETALNTLLFYLNSKGL